jgi:hypothetical protein
VMLTNIGKRKPGEAITYWLFMRRVEGKDQARRFVHELFSGNRAGADKQLREIGNRSDVKLVKEGTRHEIAKLWLEN